VAKVLAAKFKLPTVAAVFKISGNNLGKAIGARAKSVVGAKDDEYSKSKLKGILFDRYHKIPKQLDSKLDPK
jgi:hypothetical protein